jgi:hypothetical protein
MILTMSELLFDSNGMVLNAATRELQGCCSVPLPHGTIDVVPGVTRIVKDLPSHTPSRQRRQSNTIHTNHIPPKVGTNTLCPLSPIHSCFTLRFSNIRIINYEYISIQIFIHLFDDSDSAAFSIIQECAFSFFFILFFFLRPTYFYVCAKRNTI